MVLNYNKNKFLKHRKRYVKGYKFDKKKIKNGSYFIKSLENGRVTANQIEAGRKIMQRVVKIYGGTVHVYIFPTFSVSAKPTEVRMGKGKGKIKFWGCSIKKGQVIYEVSDAFRIPPQVLNKVFKQVSIKLSVLTKKIEY